MYRYIERLAVMEQVLESRLAVVDDRLVVVELGSSTVHFSEIE